MKDQADMFSNRVEANIFILSIISLLIGRQIIREKNAFFVPDSSNQLCIKVKYISAKRFC